MTVSATPYVLVEDIYEQLRSMRKQTTGQTDNADLLMARILAKKLWAKGWRTR